LQELNILISFSRDITNSDPGPSTNKGKDVDVEANPPRKPCPTNCDCREEIRDLGARMSFLEVDFRGCREEIQELGARMSFLEVDVRGIRIDVRKAGITLVDPIHKDEPVDGAVEE
jgi:hypothetical protein